MGTISLIAAIDAEIATLQSARKLLADVSSKATKPAAATPRKRHTMSAEGRAKVAAAQRKRWAAAKKLQRKN